MDIRGIHRTHGETKCTKETRGTGINYPKNGWCNIYHIPIIYIYTSLLDLPSYLYNTIRSLLHPIIPILTSNEFLSLPSPFRSSPRAKKEWFGGVDTRVPGIFDEAWLSETGTSTGTRMVIVFVFHCHSWIWMTLRMDVEIGIYSNYCNILYICRIYIYTEIGWYLMVGEGCFFLARIENTCRIIHECTIHLAEEQLVLQAS